MIAPRYGSIAGVRACRDPEGLWMGLCAWQEEKREAEDHVHGKELQTLEPIGSSVASHLSRDDRRQKNHQHKSGREGQVNRRRAKEKTREYQDRCDEERHLHTRTDCN